MSERLLVTPGCEAILAQAGLDCLASVFAFDAGERLDKPGLAGWRQRWRVRVRGSDGHEAVLYLKRFERPPMRQQVRRWLSGQPWHSTGVTEWTNAQALADAGIAAVQAIAAGQDMAGPLERRSFVLLSEAAGESLERCAPGLRGRVAGLEFRVSDLVDELARFVARFHAAGFVHRDLYLSHVFMNVGAPVETRRHSSARAMLIDTGCRGCRAVFQLIDLQRVFRSRWRRRRWVIKDLAALEFSTPVELLKGSERLRFLARYTREFRGAGSARTLARLVARKAARMRMRHQG